MKLFRFLSVFVMALTMGFSFISCADKEEVDSSDDLAGTAWEYVSKEDGYDIVQLVKFEDDIDAEYSIYAVYNDGTYADSPTVFPYSYRENDGLIVFNPKVAGNATLEGTITSGIKLRLINVSSDELIGTFYKK